MLVKTGDDSGYYIVLEDLTNHVIVISDRPQNDQEKFQPIGSFRSADIPEPNNFVMI